MVGRNAVVDDGAIVAVKTEIIDDGRLFENTYSLIAMNAKAVGMPVAKIPCRHERKKIHADAEIEISADGPAVKNNPDSFAISATRRQRCPAAIII